MMKQRNHGIDLLRIVLMFMIIVGHLFTHTNIRSEAASYSPKWIYAWILQTLALCAVNCFIIITGYYSNHNDYGIRLKKLVLLSGQVLFYSITIYTVFLLTGLIDFSLLDLVKTVFPIMSGQYWFFTSYILLMLLVPFINVMLNHLSDFKLKFLIALIILVFYCMPIFSVVVWPIDTAEGMGIIGFVTLYIIGYSLKRFEINLSKSKCICGILISCAVIFMSKLALTYIVESFALDLGTGLFYHYNTFFELINAVLMFLLFKQIIFGHKIGRIISTVSVSVFGVYLIHDHPQIWDIFWKAFVAPILNDASVLIFVFISLLIPLVIFVVCVIIDKLRGLLARYLSRVKLVGNINDKLTKLDENLRVMFYEK